MDDLSWIILGALIVLGLPAMAIAAFVMVLGLRSRVALLELRLGRIVAELDRGASALAAGAVPGAPAAPAPAPEPLAAREEPPAAESAVEPGPAAATPPPTAPEPPTAPPEPAGPRPSLEETLGTRWTVWVGGLALALGGVFLVRYSIEAGLLGPGARIVLGLIFSLLLIAAGEVMRRRGLSRPAITSRPVDIPGVVTAAGTVALFATVYAAHALYGFIGSATAFLALGAVGLATMVAAGLHGPWLAGLGLVGAYVSPVLVSSTEPRPWSLVLYLLVVTAAAFGLARLRLWRWLALASSAGALLWGFLLALQPEAGFAGPTSAHVLALGALMLVLLVVDPHRGRTADRFDTLALGCLAGLAALAFVFAEGSLATVPLATAMLVAAALLAVALGFDAVAPAAGLAALLVLGLVVAWPIGSAIEAEPVLVAPDHLSLPRLLPEALRLYLLVAATAGLALYAGTAAALLRRAPVALPPALALALAGVAGPLLLLAIVYVRATEFTQSLAFGATALGAAALLAGTGRALIGRGAAEEGDGRTGAGSVHLAGCAAALALALTMILEGSQLTFAFSLAALGVAWVAATHPLAALRWSAAGLALLVLLRFAGAWGVLADWSMTLPGWSDLLLRHALPALAFGLGGHLLRRHAADTPAAVLDGAAILLGGTAAILGVRLAIVGPHGPLDRPVDLAEAGAHAAVLLLMAAGFARAALTTTSPVHRRAAPAIAALALVATLLGPVLVENPVVTGEAVEGGALLNTLVPGFLVPALLAAVAAWLWARIATVGRQDEPALAPTLARPLSKGLSALGLLLAFLYLTLETRVAVSGPDMSFFDIPAAESYAYSAVWLLFGIALLAAGLAFASRGARLASAAVILLTVAKVFLVDMGDLEGVWRALSFIGLGAVLIGIGLVYQRLLFPRARPEAQPGG
jgi:uncharacterized membrane protein